MPIWFTKFLPKYVASSGIDYRFSPIEVFVTKCVNLLVKKSLNRCDEKVNKRAQRALGRSPEEKVKGFVLRWAKNGL